MIALRLMRLAGGGAAGVKEARLMVTDKMAALTEAQLAAAATFLTGDGLYPVPSGSAISRGPTALRNVASPICNVPRGNSFGCLHDL